MAIITNSANLSVGYNINTPNPIDGRTIVNNKEDLIDNTKWNLATELYNGLPVYVRNTKEYFILADKDHALVTLKTATEEQKKAAYSCWVEVATLDSVLTNIKNLGPVFKFKGIASAIDPDHTTLTIGSGTIDITEGETTNSEKLISYGTVLQENLDNVKYAWGTSELPNLFFTDALYTTKNEDLTLYKKGDTTTLQYINVFDTLYFYKEDQSVNMETGTRTYKVWEALDNGGILYSLTRTDGALDVYTVTSTSELPTALISNVAPNEYTYYTFTPLEDAEKYTVSITSDISTIDANSENNGHVYQLGEEEYASNGNMWVQLGSPKTDWIVL